METVSCCFGCHATGFVAPAELQAMLPGVSCERRHGAGGAHAAAARLGKPGPILNPKKLGNRQKVQLCSQCHRSPANEYLSLTPELEDPASIRFAPVGLMASRFPAIPTLALRDVSGSTCRSEARHG